MAHWTNESVALPGKLHHVVAAHRYGIYVQDVDEMRERFTSAVPLAAGGTDLLALIKFKDFELRIAWDGSVERSYAV